MHFALTRPISDSLAHCQLTHLPRHPIDLALAKTQHAAYESALSAQGLHVIRAPAAPDLPDAVFVEDIAIVTDELAIMTRPGAESRRGESAGVAQILAAYSPLKWMTDPATLDGGDVLRIARTFYVGQSSRTNSAGIAQLRGFLSPLGYQLRSIEIDQCLHLKSAVTALADDLLLLNPQWVSAKHFPGLDHIAVDPTEPYAANALALPKAILYPTHFPQTCERLQKHGLKLTTIDSGELAKAEGAVTCCSIIFRR